MIIYGIPNCGSVKKAMDWMKTNNITFEFHDYKKKGITKKKLKEWCKLFGWENLINKAGTTWKGLTDDEKNKVVDEASAIEVMMNNTSLIKRPIVEANGKYLIRFKEEEYAQQLL
ncbi:MAG: Arsenate reductase and related [Segetibacter sp.]|nr:Arsenate reductase and related [Segetibacter sp.]